MPEETRTEQIISAIEDVLKRYGYDGGLCEITFYESFGGMQVTIKR